MILPLWVSMVCASPMAIVLMSVSVNSKSSVLSAMTIFSVGCAVALVKVKIANAARAKTGPK